MHPKAVIVLLLVLALCRCCVGGPKPRKGKGSSTGFLLFHEGTNSLKRVEKNKQKQKQQQQPVVNDKGTNSLKRVEKNKQKQKQQQQPVVNDKVPTPGNSSYYGFISMRFSRDQLDMLERKYWTHQYLALPERAELAYEIGVAEWNVKVGQMSPATELSVGVQNY
uniref:Homeobox domain-containing protein n=1 Tax=Globodera pallida TaxID=36090 RepID=A0A183BNA1_GLOPA